MKETKEQQTLVNLTPLPDENAQAYEALTIYARLGARRSMNEVARQSGLGRSTVQNWAKRYDWQKRIKALTVRTEAKERAKIEQASREAVEEWDGRAEEAPAMSLLSA